MATLPSLWRMSMRRIAQYDWLGLNELNKAALTGRKTPKAVEAFEKLLEYKNTSYSAYLLKIRGLSSLNRALAYGNLDDALDILAVEPIPAHAIKELNKQADAYEDELIAASDAQHERELYNHYGIGGYGGSIHWDTSRGSRRASTSSLRDLEMRVARLEARRR